MQVTKEQIEPRTVALDIEVDADTVTQAFARAYREFSAYVRVPGFRPGKAPRHMVEQYVNPDRLVERVTELVAVPAFREAVTQEQIEVYGEPSVEFSDLSDKQPFRFKCVIAQPPIVELGDYTGIEVERPVYEPNPKDVEERIEDIRKEYARLVQVSARGVKESDWIIAETSVSMEGDEGTPETKRTLIRMGNNIPGFDEAVLGAKVDETRTFTLTYPEDYQEPEKAGKAATFTIKVASINERVLPELTDAWVREVIGEPDIETWRANLLETLKRNTKDYADQIAEGRIVEAIVQRSKVEFPNVLVEQEVRQDLAQLDEELSRRENSYEEFLAANEITAEQHQNALAARAVERVRARLVLRELALKENIRVTADEVEQAFTEVFANDETDERALKRLMRDERRRGQVANLVVQRKLRDLLFSLATVKDVPVEQ
jgi:trigger factor